MLRSWKSLGLGLVALLGVVAVLPMSGSLTRPSTALAATGVNILVDSDPEGGTGFGFATTTSAGCTLGTGDDSFSLNDGGTRLINCTETGAVTFTFTVTPAAGSVIDPSDSQCGNFNSGTFTLAVAADAVGSCLISFNIDVTQTATVTTTPGTQTPTVTATGVPISTLTVSVAPSTLSCSGSAFVTVVAKNAAGAVIPGGTITLSTNLGTISPTSAVDSGAGVLAVLSGNNQGGTATITATAGGVTGTGTATINCAAAPTATSIPATAVPPSTSGVQPPRTGEAGLATHRGGSDAAMIAGLLLLALAGAGALRFAWPRIRG
jgi:hypothetical protein